MSGAAGAGPGEPRLLVPLYEHPAVRPEAWRRLFLAAPRLYGVVLNPASGVGTAPDPAFAEAGAGLRAAGVRLLGYADTAYGRRPAAEVAAELARYRAWYGTGGAFLDQAPSGPGELAGFRRLVRRLRDEGEAGVLAANHGTLPDPGYAELAELLVTFEGDWESYRRAPLPAWPRPPAPGRVCHLVYGVPRGRGRVAAALAARRGAGVCCPVPGALPHPWDALPDQLEPGAPAPGAPVGSE